MSGQINCPAPLPEGPADARLAKLLVPAPYVVPEKKDAKKATGTRKSAGRQEVSDPYPTFPRRIPPVKTRRKKKRPLPPPAGGEKKRKDALSGEAGGSKKGKTLPPDYSTDADDGGEEWLPRAKPLAKS